MIFPYAAFLTVSLFSSSAEPFLHVQKQLFADLMVLRRALPESKRHLLALYIIPSPTKATLLNFN
jgi:hypothetical protein